MAADAPPKKEEAPKKDEKGKKPGDKDAPKKEVELSDEDAALKEALELMVTRASDPEPGVVKLALEGLRKEIRTATSSMTSVPKPLKFLRPHYAGLTETYEKCTHAENKKLLADILSLLAMTRQHVAGEVPESLKYRLLGSSEEIGTWGHEYVRNLAGEIGIEFARRTEAAGTEGTADVKDLMSLVRDIVPFHMTHNAEPEAVDLLVEVEQLPMLVEHIDEKNFARTCLYLVSCAAYVPDLDDSATCYKVALSAYIKVGRIPEALRVALMLGTKEAIETAFLAAPDATSRRQLAYMLGRAGWPLDLDDGPLAAAVGDEADSLKEIVANTKQSELYLALARDLDVMAPKVPEDIYKTHLVEGRAATDTAVDSARSNLAATFVNAFVNAGFGTDKLLTAAEESPESVSWIYKNKDHGKVSAAASLGCILMWDVEGGLPQIDKYLYAPDPNVVAGALLAVGITTNCVRTEYDPAFALISEHVAKESRDVRLGAILGLGIAYAGASKEDVSALLTPVVTDPTVTVEVAGYAALSLGLVFVGTANQECAESIVQALMTRSETELDQPMAKLLVLGLGLLFLGLGSAVEATLEVAKTLAPRLSRYSQVLLEGCAYAGTGNVLKVQSLLAVVGEHIEKEEGSPAWADEHQSVAVLGIALVALGEELGAEMAGKVLEHVLQYGETSARRAVPLALALLNASNPKLNVTDALGRLSHDAHQEVAEAAMLSMGLAAAGTNNARVAAQLRQLSSYYYKDAGMLFLVRIAQGLVHMGKGLLTISPFHSDRGLLRKSSLAALLTVAVASLDMKETLLGKHHQLLFALTCAMTPRMLFTVDEQGKPLPVSVRVGEAVDIVGQAGRPKTITGFQTHTTPVLLSVGERAELATEKYIPVSPILEGVVILKPNPDYVEPPAGSGSGAK